MTDAVDRIVVREMEFRIREAKDAVPDCSTLIECYNDLCECITYLLKVWNTEGSRVRIGELEGLIQDLYSQIAKIIDSINILKSTVVTETGTYSKKQLICYER